MASDLSAAVREPVIWYVSCPYGEPSVRCPVPVAGGGDASVSMEPEGVTMASSISAAIREPGVTVSHLRLMSREVSVWIVRYL